MLDKFIVYSDIGEQVQSDKEVLAECKFDMVQLLNDLGSQKKSAEEWGETLIDYLEEKLSDNHILLLDTFYS